MGRRNPRKPKGMEERERGEESGALGEGGDFQRSLDSMLSNAECIINWNFVELLFNMSMSLKWYVISVISLLSLLFIGSKLTPFEDDVLLLFTLDDNDDDI